MRRTSDVGRRRTTTSPTTSTSSRRAVGLLLGLLGVVLVGAGLGGRRGLAVALGGAVVGVVEAGALEVHGDRVEDALDRARRRPRTRSRDRRSSSASRRSDGRSRSGTRRSASRRPSIGRLDCAPYARSHHGRGRRALQAARPDLPRLRDLRRHRQHVRLRALRRPAQAQRHRRVVEGDDPGARRHRRAGLGDHPAPAHVGGLRPPRRLQRPARPVPGQVQAALPAGPPAGGGRGARRGPGDGQVPASAAAT